MLRIYYDEENYFEVNSDLKLVQRMEVYGHPYATKLAMMSDYLHEAIYKKNWSDEQIYKDLLKSDDLGEYALELI